MSFLVELTPSNGRAGLTRCFAYAEGPCKHCTVYGDGPLSKGDCPEYEPRANDAADILRYYLPQAFLLKANIGCESKAKYRAGAGGDLDFPGPLNIDRDPWPSGVAPTSAADCGRAFVASPMSCPLLEQQGGAVRATANNCLAPRLRWSYCGIRSESRCNAVSTPRATGTNASH